MGLTLQRALRLDDQQSGAPRKSNVVAFVGAGGKTAAIFVLARESPKPVAVAATTHLGVWQTKLADQHVVVTQEADIPRAPQAKVTLFTGPPQPDGRTQPLAPPFMELLRGRSAQQGMDLLIEADGSRERPLKAPADHEPPIPAWAQTVVVVAGMLGLGRPLTAENVHRPELFADLANLEIGAEIDSEAIRRVLCDTRGGLRGIPTSARRIVLLNQADTAVLQAKAQSLARSLVGPFETAVVASLRTPAVYAAHEKTAGIILAAGAATRFGKPKQLLPWQGRPFVVAVSSAAVKAGLEPVTVVTGAYARDVALALVELPVSVVVNQGWEAGQSTSVAEGIRACPPSIGAVVFLLADQPAVTPEIVKALVDAHASRLSPIVAPLVNEEHRANPVLFDRSTFPDLLGLKGDVGGRALFASHKVEYLPWYDDSLLWEVDTPEDYDRLTHSDPL